MSRKNFFGPETLISALRTKPAFMYFTCKKLLLVTDCYLIVRMKVPLILTKVKIRRKSSRVICLLGLESSLKSI
jgi:hypothetical protein